MKFIIMKMNEWVWQFMLEMAFQEAGVHGCVPWWCI